MYFSAGGNDRGVTVDPKITMQVRSPQNKLYESNPQVQDGDYLKFRIHLDISEGKEYLRMWDGMTSPYHTIEVLALTNNFQVTA